MLENADTKITLHITHARYSQNADNVWIRYIILAKGVDVD